MIVDSYDDDDDDDNDAVLPGGQSGRWKHRLCMYGDNLRRNAAHVYSGYRVTRGACAVEARA